MTHDKHQTPSTNAGESLQRIIENFQRDGRFNDDHVALILSELLEAEQRGEQKTFAQFRLLSRRVRAREQINDDEDVSLGEPDTLRDYWLAYYVGKDGRCLLCLNGGLIYPGDNDAGVICPCPFGRAVRGDEVTCLQRLRDLETLLDPKTVLFEQITAKDLSKGDRWLANESGDTHTAVDVEHEGEDRSVIVRFVDEERDKNHALTFAEDDVLLRRLP